MGEPTQYPVFIPVRDRLSFLLELLAWLEQAGQRDIWLIDNDSTYPPMVDFLDSTHHHVVRTSRNMGHRSPWLSGTVQRHAHGRYFIVTDPDVVPDPACPPDVLDVFLALLDEFPQIDKAGFGLRIDDLPECYSLREDVIDWERPFWERELRPGVFDAGIDTTFAMYRPIDGRHKMLPAVRTGFPYVARHLPWYIDSSNLGEETTYYRDHADRSISNWDRDELPWWKQRRLGPRQSATDEQR